MLHVWRLLEYSVFAWAVGTEYFWPAIISAVIGIVLLCIGKSDVGEITGDERTRRINEITSLRITRGRPVPLCPHGNSRSICEGITHYNRIIGAHVFRTIRFRCSVMPMYITSSLYYKNKYGA